MTNRESNEGSTLPKGRGLYRLGKIQKSKILIGAAAVVVAFILMGSLVFSGDKPTRTESYKEVSGAAGLNATINYDCEQSCSYDFNVYMYKDDGRQVNVVRPDKDGNVNLAMPEGNYVMLIGKQFGKNVFPQEPLALKNGQVLELKLDYR